jgi:hypothetical protein
MAIVSKLERNQEMGTSFQSQTEVRAECKIAMDEDGKRYIQIRTMGSINREIPNKQSQNILIAPEALPELEALIAELKGLQHDEK